MQSKNRYYYKIKTNTYFGFEVNHLLDFSSTNHYVQTHHLFNECSNNYLLFTYFYE